MGLEHAGGPRLPLWEPEGNSVIMPIYDERPPTHITQSTRLTQTHGQRHPDGTRYAESNAYSIHFQLYSMVIPPPQIRKIKAIQAVQEQPKPQNSQPSRRYKSHLAQTFCQFIPHVQYIDINIKPLPNRHLPFHDTNNIETQPQNLRKDKARPQTRPVISPACAVYPKAKLLPPLPIP